MVVGRQSARALELFRVQGFKFRVKVSRLAQAYLFLVLGLGFRVHTGCEPAPLRFGFRAPC